MFKRTKFTRGKTCIKPPKRWVKKQSTGIGEALVSSVRRLRKLATCEISQVAKIRNLQNLQVAKFCNPQNFNSLLLPSLINLLRISSNLIMHLQIRLRFIVFELN